MFGVIIGFPPEMLVVYGYRSFMAVPTAHAICKKIGVQRNF
jgi:hypothetical protein